MTAQYAIKKEQAAQAVFDWNGLSEVQAIMELCNRMEITMSVNPDGKLSATGNTKAAHEYLGDIAPRYRGAVIAHLLALPAPDVSVDQDNVNILANVQALDATIAAYCAAAGRTIEHRDMLLSVRRRMAAYLLVQNLCAFRVWLYEAKKGSDHGNQ